MRLAGGFRMGPFELLDLIGLEVNLAVTRSIYDAFSEPPRFRPHLIQEEMVQAGLLGRKTGRGFYDYGTEGGVERRSPTPPAPPRVGEPRRLAVLGEGDLAEGFKAAALAAGWTVRGFPSDPAGYLTFPPEVNVEELIWGEGRGGLSRNVPVSGVEREAARALIIESIGGADAIVDLSLNQGEMLLALAFLAPALRPGSVWLSLMLETSLTEWARYQNPSGHQWLQQVVGIATLPPWHERGLIEILADPLSSPGAVATAVSLFRELGKETALVKNAVGGVFPRIFAMIVNEAALALGEGVASAADIDTALRLGANYPQGPLELADEIGLEVLLGIVYALSHDGPRGRYEPAPLLREIGLDAGLAIGARLAERGAGPGFHTYKEHNG